MAFGRTSHCPNPTPFAELRRTLGARLMWFLIASEQITQAKNRVNQSITMEQLLEAEQRAAEWMRKTKTKKHPPSSIDNPPNASTA